MSNSHRSSRFSTSAWMEKLVPAVLAILVLALLVTLIIIGLSVAGITPSA